MYNETASSVATTDKNNYILHPRSRHIKFFNMRRMRESSSQREKTIRSNRLIQ